MEKELYELNDGQRLIFYGLNFIKHKEVINIALEFQIDEEIDLHYLMQAVNLAALRNPNNSIQIIKKEDKIYQHFSDKAHDKIEYIEFNKDSDYIKYIDSFAKTKFRNNYLNTQLYKVSVIKKPNQKYAICGCFAHLVYDSYSAAMFFKDVFDIYEALVQGEPLPKESISPFKLYDEQNKYINSKKHNSDLEFYKKVFSTEPQYTIIGGKNSLSFRKNKRTGIKTFAVCPSFKSDSLLLYIENSIRDSIYEYAKNNNVTPQSLFLFACRSYLSYACNTNDVTIRSTVNRRSTLIEKNAGGTTADAIEFRTIIDNASSFKEGLINVYNELLEYFKHSYFGVEETCSLIGELHNVSKLGSYDSTIITYQPATKLSKNIKYSFKRLPNGREWSACYINIIPYNSDNEYVIDYSYLPKLISRNSIQEFHDFMINFIKEGITNDSIKISDIIAKVGK